MRNGECESEAHRKSVRASSATRGGDLQRTRDEVVKYVTVESTVRLSLPPNVERPTAFERKVESERLLLGALRPT